MPINKLKSISIAGLVAIFIFAGFAGCKKDGNPNNLPPVNPGDYEGKIDGFTSSDEIFPENLIAYWSFDDTKNELKTGTAPASSANDSYVTGGVRGKALGLAAGYLLYTNQFQKFKTDTLKSWTISLWVKVLDRKSVV